MDIIVQAWPWYVAGPVIALTFFLLLYFGGRFGVSSNLRVICAISGAGKYADFFRFDWKKQQWNLVFVFGAIVGGFIASNYLMPLKGIALHKDIVMNLNQLGFQNVGTSFLPPEIFSLAALKSVKGVVILVLGGFMVGFGARYAGGCTSGHAISGLSNLQVPSLVAVIGFFIGGLIMTHFIIPQLF